MSYLPTPDSYGKLETELEPALQEAIRKKGRWVGGLVDE